MTVQPALMGKKALILGVANSRSLAWGIAQALHQSGAEIALSCQSEKLQKKITRLSTELSSPPVFACDLSDPIQVAELFGKIKKCFGTVDILIHSVAFAPIETLSKPFLETSKEEFNTTFQSSVYSLIETTRYATQLMPENGGAILTLSYIGAQRVMSGYGIMGPAKAALECSVKYLAHELGCSNIRINTISAGPIKTLSSSVFDNFNNVLELVEKKTPLRKNISADDVGGLAAFLCSDSAKMITGSTYYIDSGAHILGA